ncbi:hypothetical protein KDW_50640 [Dictyobacter vulcani]|uniref:Protein kinase domain-containing protein n=1 Tax=Dictyobacter vulcani TaxID=2607529 RepID=A0A5J4KUL6_9CHLR|nr:serine/threonine-protein kinase [Dictyobacter vulcani]GER90902.1 hypothetical protein KDW_50640 [Dictyobacter vulcani]
MSLDGMYLGRYHLLHVLGSGGMGEVYLADDTRIKRHVAVKVVRNDAPMLHVAEAIQRSTQLFEREMHAIASLDHPAILPLFDYGEQEVNGTTITYMVMPYRSEGSLYQWMQTRNDGQLLPLADVARFIEQAASALQHAHNQGIVHQDVKPDNFLLRIRPEQPAQPDLLLADFGVARSLSGTSHSTQTIRGTLMYMAPEQWDGHPVLASDQYALAIMAYELLVGYPPFDGRPGTIMYKHLSQHPDPPSSRNPALPTSVDTVLLKALAKRPEERFNSVTDFARAFRQALQTVPGGVQMSSALPGLSVPQSGALRHVTPLDHSAPTIAAPPGQRARPTRPQIAPLPPRRAPLAHDFFARKTTLLTLLILVFLLGGVGWVYAFTLSHPSNGLDVFAHVDTSATRTAVAKSLHSMRATQTAVAQQAATATARAQAHLQATSTALARQHVAATSTAVANAQLLQANQTSFTNLAGCSTMGADMATCPVTLTNRSDTDENWYATSDRPSYLGVIATRDGDDNQGTVGAQDTQKVDVEVSLLCFQSDFGDTTAKTAHFTIQAPHNAIPITVTWKCQ